MTYTFEWAPLAEQQLADVWMAAVDPDAVTRASHRLDQHLRRHRLHVGGGRDSSVRRTASDGPLGIEYQVIEDDKKVWSRPPGPSAKRAGRDDDSEPVVRGCGSVRKGEV